MSATSFKLYRRIDDRIIRLRSAAGENNFRWFTAEQRSEPFPRKSYAFSSHGRIAVSTRRVAVILGQKRQHLLDHSGSRLRPSIVIDRADLVIHCRNLRAQAFTLANAHA